jgi:MATE family multidrug resistance protein
MSQAGQMTVVMADTIMVGRLGEVPLAAVSLASNLSVISLFLGLGLSFGITPLVGKSFGSGDSPNISFMLRQSRYAGLITGLALTLFMALIYCLIPFMGQPAEVVDATKPYFLVLMCTMLPAQIFAFNKQFAEGLSNTRVAMIITVSGNIVNIFFNYVLIFGKLGFPEMGMIGAAYATLLSKVLMALFMDLSVRRLSVFRPYHLAASKYSFDAGAQKRIVVQGLPIGGQMVIEVVAFSAGAVMMGWISTSALAAHQVVMTLVSFTYMISAGLSAATTIKISIFRGQRQFAELRNSAWASIHMVVLFMFFTGTVFLAGRYVIPLLFISDSAVIEIAAGLLLIGGLFQLFDGVQVTALGVLRGLEDFFYPAFVSGIAYIMVSLPVGYLLAIVVGVGPSGIWIGYLMGLAVAGLLLVFRIRKQFKRIETGLLND